MESLQGKLLIAAPSLADSNFNRSVVLIIQHDSEGAFGVVLNRCTDKTVRELWDEIGQGDCPCNELLHLGGPVSGPLMALHTNMALAEKEIVPGVYLATSREHIDSLVVDEDENTFRLFAGYAGWGEGQLETELEVGGWFTLPAEHEFIFWPAEDLWHQASTQFTGDLLKEIGVTHVPDDPSMN